VSLCHHQPPENNVGGASGQLEKIFFCFPDPHFKTKNFRRRIISHVLLSEYAYFLAPNARLYAISDVEELHNWHVEKLSEHPCFERIDNEVALATDPCVRAMIDETEEGKKVARLGGSKHFCVFRRLDESELKPPSIFRLWDDRLERESL
jgi:tRNA (guanine-N7-)-methyltransferase